MLSDGYANTLSREGPDDDSAVMEGVGDASAQPVVILQRTFFDWTPCFSQR